MHRHRIDGLHDQLEAVGRVLLQRGLKVLAPACGIGVQDEPLDRSAQQRIAFHPQQRGGREVDFQEASAAVEREIADRCEIVEVDEAVAGGGQVELGAAQLFVL